MMINFHASSFNHNLSICSYESWFLIYFSINYNGIIWSKPCIDFSYSFYISLITFYFWWYLHMKLFFNFKNVTPLCSMGGNSSQVGHGFWAHVWLKTIVPYWRYMSTAFSQECPYAIHATNSMIVLGASYSSIIFIIATSKEFEGS